MIQPTSPPIQRQLILTPYVHWFLEKCGKTDSAKELSEDICRALDGQYKKSGCIRFSAPTFLLLILDAETPTGPERVFVWHGPRDGGPFFKASMLENAISVGLNLM